MIANKLTRSLFKLSSVRRFSTLIPDKMTEDELDLIENLNEFQASVQLIGDKKYAKSAVYLNEGLDILKNAN